MRDAARKRFPGAIVALLIVVVLLALLAWAQRGLARCDPPILSPLGSYQVELCAPAFSSIMVHGSMPRYVKFYDVRRKQALGESEVLDFNGRGGVVWPSVGMPNIIVGLGPDAPSVKVLAPDGQ